MNDFATLLRQHLADWQSGWSMGSFGAIAEFHQDEGERPEIDAPDELTRATARGAIRINREQAGGIVPVAYETLSPRPHRWSQAVALCLPEAAARRSARAALTELGPDRDAIRPQDRDAVLFDMGLALPQCDFCIRTGDTDLIAVLRKAEGRSIFAPDNHTMGAILKVHPHRIALTSIGRVEVYQKIGGPDTGGVSPPGPHSHVLPKLLRTGRTHSANTPIPEGLLPLGALHPGNPVIGPMGEDQAFDPALHKAFQALHSAYGPPGMAAVKDSVLGAVEAGEEPAAFAPPPGRAERAAVRLALRQQARAAEALGDAAGLARLQAWLAVFEPGGASEAEEDDAPGY
ncbi:DUF6925 family protein [Mesorhizobium xinjiangense]|uniref:DUF6925 family protein n=1 Tax=Mesorhizobium xinjiangense TaxID=2678685 RepID=UPI0012EDDD3E|nr:hypothetical protein [Mesorhizobium xinjiangense]